SVLNDYKGSVLIFCRTKHKARDIATAVRRMGHGASEIHSNRSLSQRREALDGFKIGRYRVLVATDIAARGIDVSGIELVLNYDLPATAEDYVHRIGRTGRAGLAGHAISFATPDQRPDVRSIERLIKKSLPVSKAPFAPMPMERLSRPLMSAPARRQILPKREHRPTARPFRSASRPSFPPAAAPRSGFPLKREGKRSEYKRGLRPVVRRHKGTASEDHGYFLKRNKGGGFSF
ncbi:MAG: helicase-related protein, partial [Acidobacteriaceae bacterium]